MLEIKTIIETIGDAPIFDREVNAELEAGWELVRRDIIPAQSPERHVLLYAELERQTETEEEYELTDDGSAEWVIQRDPVKPYRCSACGFAAPADWFMCNAIPTECPNCQRIMFRRTE